MKNQNGDDGAPDWAWYITRGIMLAGVIINIIYIARLLTR